MTDIDDDYDDRDDRDDYDDSPEPDDYDDDQGQDYYFDGDDYELARQHAEYAEHCEEAHGGGECRCRPPWWRQTWWWLDGKGRSLRNVPFRLRVSVREIRTIRVGQLELTVRYRPRRQCGACKGDGWFYTKTGLRTAKPMPADYDGVSLCGCGSAVTRLADTRRVMRSAANEPPF